MSPMKPCSIRRPVLWGALLAATLILAACGRDVTIVGVLEPDQSDAVDQARTGFLEALTDAGFRGGENARFLRRNAEFRDEPLDDLAADLVDDEDVDFLFAIGSESLAAAITAIDGERVFFAQSMSPLLGGLLRSPWSHETIAAGASVPPATGDLVTVARQLLPAAQRLAILFDPDDLDSRFAREIAVAASRDSGFSPMELPIAGEADDAVREAIASGAEVLLLTPSRLLDRAFSRILDLANEAGVPVLGWSERQAAKGALAAVGVDPEENGRLAGTEAAKVLSGQAGRVDLDSVAELWVSERAAARLGLAIPAEVASRASEVFR